MFNKIRPEHFDLLGIAVFPLIFCYALYELLTGATPARVVVVLLLLTGIIGAIIDGSVVYHFFIKKKE